MSAPIQPEVAPPPGVALHFEDPFTLQLYQSIVVAGCIIYTTLAVIARMFTKILVIKRLDQGGL